MAVTKLIWGTEIRQHTTLEKVTVINRTRDRNNCDACKLGGAHTEKGRGWGGAEAALHGRIGLGWVATEVTSKILDTSLELENGDKNTTLLVFQSLLKPLQVLMNTASNFCFNSSLKQMQIFSTTVKTRLPLFGLVAEVSWPRRGCGLENTAVRCTQCHCGGSTATTCASRPAANAATLAHRKGSVTGVLRFEDHQHWSNEACENRILQSQAWVPWRNST